MKKRNLWVLALALVMATSGCGNDKSKNVTDETTAKSSENTTDKSDETEVINTDDMFTDRDYDTEYDESKSAVIELKGDSAICSSDAVKIKGTTITISDEGTYVISGSLDDGMIIVDADDKDKPHLVFKGVTITSKTSAPVYILEAEKVFITLAEGTENNLANGGTFTAIDDNNIDAAIFSKQDLTINGSGSLTVTSPAGHGIVSKDDLVFTGGTVNVDSSSHGLDANDSVRIVGAQMTIDSGKDGIHSENSDDADEGFVYIENGTFQIEAEGDGISAGAYMQIENGTYNIVSGGGSANATQKTSDGWGGFRGGPGQKNRATTQSTDNSDSSEANDSSTSIKAIKAGNDLIINNGTFVIDSADDSIHANASITVNNGTFNISSGDDAFHADTTLTIADGIINIAKSYEGLEGLDIKISGGDVTIVASDDGINAAGGTDSSGFGGQRGNDKFDGHGGPGGPGGSSNSNGSISISGGKVYINASGDGIDANGSFEVSGGDVLISGPTQGDTSVLDYDTTGKITGGTFIGTGASMMAQTFSDSEQGVISASVSQQAAGTVITLTDANGKEVISRETELPFQIIILSSPDIVKGETYTLSVGEATKEFTAY